MALFNISYDLIAQKDYTRLNEGIKKVVVTWARPLASTWLVEWNGSTVDLAKAIVAFMDEDDKIFVTRVPTGGGSVAWRCIDQKVINWFNQVAARQAA